MLEVEKVAQGPPGEDDYEDAPSHRGGVELAAKGVGAVSQTAYLAVGIQRQ